MRTIKCRIYNLDEDVFLNFLRINIIIFNSTTHYTDFHRLNFNFYNS